MIAKLDRGCSLYEDLFLGSSALTLTLAVLDMSLMPRFLHSPRASFT
jgi:hypothetical protein